MLPLTCKLATKQTTNWVTERVLDPKHDFVGQCTPKKTWANPRPMLLAIPWFASCHKSWNYHVHDDYIAFEYVTMATGQWVGREGQSPPSDCGPLMGPLGTPWVNQHLTAIFFRLLFNHVKCLDLKSISTKTLHNISWMKI